MRKRKYELSGTDEDVASGTPGGYGRRGMGGRVSYMHGQLVPEKAVDEKERLRFTTGRSLNQLNSKLRELTCSGAKLQIIIEPCKIFFKKSLPTQARKGVNKTHNKSFNGAKVQKDFDICKYIKSYYAGNRSEFCIFN